MINPSIENSARRQLTFPQQADNCYEMSLWEKLLLFLYKLFEMRLSYMSAVLLFFASTTFAQTYPDPVYYKKPVYFDSSTYSITALERQIRPLKMTSFGLTTTRYYKAGQSPVRIKNRENVQFLIKWGHAPGLDLCLLVYPLQTSQDKANRVWEVKSAIQPYLPSGLNFRYEKVGEDTYKITFPVLAPGEYLWYLDVASYLFAVD